MSVPPTLRELARAAGVSASTVSRALRNDPSVTLEKRQMIMQVAERLGYRANPLANAFAAYIRSHKDVQHIASLAFLVPSPETLHGRFGLSVLAVSTARRAESLGYSFDLIYFGGFAGEPGKLESILRARSIQGLLLPPLRITDPPLTFTAESYAGVAVGNAYGKPAYPIVRNDQYHTSFTAVSEAFSRGYRRIGLHLYERVHHRTDSRFLGGYSAGCYEKRLPSIPPLISDQLDPGTLRDWISTYQIDAVLSGHLECLTTLRQIGLRVPEDIGYATLHLPPAGADGIAGIDQNDIGIAEAAVDVLVGQLNRNHRGPERIVRSVSVPGSWVDGATLPNRRE